jgi:hypothetical protein
MRILAANIHVNGLDVLKAKVEEAKNLVDRLETVISEINELQFTVEVKTGADE